MAVIPFCAPQLRLKRFSAAVDEAIQGVLGGRQLILGREVERFEENFATYLAVRHCVALNSGTDALILALRSLDIGPGHEVITVSMTSTATAMAILHTGAQPRFVDVDQLTRCMDLAQVEAAVTARTAAILPVHLHGYPIDMPRLMAIAERHRLAVVEDCAQAHGARIGGRAVGSWGHLGAFSFYPTKNLGCAGDGGAVVTHDAALAVRVRALRNYSWSDERRISTELGYNSRLDELQAAILNVLLPHLDEGNRERAALAASYCASLDGTGVDLPADHSGAVYHQFAICVEARDALRLYLKDRAGIETGIHYPIPLHHQPLYAGYATAPLPVTDHLARSMISLPIQPEVVGDRVADIVRNVRAGIAECKAS
jgi:dTDP-3-amino-3,4,6-trideoxy-alpha-D-glucose transaminase